MATIFDPEPADARPVAVIDVEASGLGKTYPIEIAIAKPETGGVRTWLIQPTREWRDHWRWDPVAEALHGIALDDCLGYGLPVERVAAEVAEAVAGHLVLSDNVAADEGWLTVLCRAAGAELPCRLEDYWTVALEMANRAKGRVSLKEARAEAQRLFPVKHRAEPDVGRLAHILRVLGGCSDGAEYGR